MIAGVICGALGLLLIIFAILICRYLGPGLSIHHIRHPHLQVFGPWAYSSSYSPSLSAGIWALGFLLIIFAILICRYLGPGLSLHHIRHPHLHVFGPWDFSSSYSLSSSAGIWALDFLYIIFAIPICRYLVRCIDIRREKNIFFLLTGYSIIIFFVQALQAGVLLL